MLYADSSALLKRYVEEADSGRADDFLRSDDALVTGRHTLVEVRRNLARLLGGTALVDSRRQFNGDISAFAIVELDADTCELAASIGEQTGVRTVDALHLGAARRVGGQAITFLTFDLRQAQAARGLGFSVVGS